jgi:hypothetical protein
MMSNNKIYSYRASGNGSKVKGRICAANMNDATNQVVAILQELDLRGMNVSINELKNQAKAMKEWQEDQQLNALADSRQDQKRIPVDINSL